MSMRKKIKGLIMMAVLLICFSVPAAAATESFHFEQKTDSVQVGKTKELTVYNHGKKVDPKKVQWKSSNPKLAAISNGKVTAKSWGNVQIFAVYGGKKISCKVYTYNQLIYTDFTGYKTTPIKTKKGRTVQLKPEKHGSTVFYKSSNTKIATVSSSGVVTPKTTGTVKITCISFGKNRYIASAKVVVGAELKSISTSSEIVMNKGEQKTLKVTVHPANAYVRTITYATSNSAVTVSKTGKITAKAPGLVKITVTADGGKKIKNTIQVYVQDKKTGTSNTPLNGSTGMILHRGLSLEAPENTLPAFNLAGQRGAEYVETDVRQLKDGTFVIFHDSNLLRMCGVDKKIENLTYQEVKKYPVIAGTNASAYKNNTIPTLEQYLQCCNKYSMTPVIEIKSNLNQNGVAKFNQIIKKSRKSPVVISFKEEPLIMLRQINRTVSIQWILRDQITSAALNECARYKFDISAQYGCTYKNIIARAHSKNIKVALWLFTDSSIADCYKNWGADYLTCERMM